MNKKQYFEKFLQWRARHVSDTTFMLILSIFIGFFAGIAAALMKSLVYSIEEKILSFYTSSDQILIYFFFPFNWYLTNGHLFKDNLERPG